MLAYDASAAEERKVTPREWLRARMSVPLVCFGASAATYLATLCPTLTLGDGPEVATAMHELGVAHPTGYPLFVVLGHVFGRVFAVGDVAWRYNVLSALLGAAAVGVFAAALVRLTRSPWAAFTGAMSFALTPTFWAQSTELEVYSLHILFSAATLALWLRFEDDGRLRDLYGLALCVGLSATHHAMSVLALPWLALALTTGDRSWLTPGRALRLLGLGVAPICLYAYLPLAARHTPDLSWGLGPGAAPGALLAHMTGARFHASLDWTHAPAMLVRYGFGLERTYSLLLALAAVGLWSERERPRRLACLVLGYTTALAFALSYAVPDRDVFFLPSTLFVAVFIALGAAAVLRRAERAQAGRRLRPGPLLAAAPLLLVYLQMPTADRSGFYRAHDETLAALALVPPGGTFLGHDGAAPAYVRTVVGVRQDVEVVDVALDYRTLYPPALERLRDEPPGVARARAVARTLVAAAETHGDGVYLLPGRSDLGWRAAGLYRIELGVADVLRRAPPRVIVDRVPPHLHSGELKNGLWMRGVELDRRTLRQGELVRLHYFWELGPPGTADDLEVVTIVAGAREQVPQDFRRQPLFVNEHRLGQGADLRAEPPGTLVREELFLQVPFAFPPGDWWIWIGVRRPHTNLFQPFVRTLRAYHPAVPIRVEPGERTLWRLPAVPSAPEALDALPGGSLSEGRRPASSRRRPASAR